jgi:hypothetical protein
MKQKVYITMMKDTRNIVCACRILAKNIQEKPNMGGLGVDMKVLLKLGSK